MDQLQNLVNQGESLVAKLQLVNSVELVVEQLEAEFQRDFPQEGICVGLGDLWNLWVCQSSPMNAEHDWGRYSATSGHIEGSEFNATCIFQKPTTEELIGCKAEIAQKITDGKLRNLFTNNGQIVRKYRRRSIITHDRISSGLGGGEVGGGQEGREKGGGGQGRSDWQGPASGHGRAEPGPEKPKPNLTEYYLSHPLWARPGIFTQFRQSQNLAWDGQEILASGDSEAALLEVELSSAEEIYM
ncbi:hypothetical protein BU17DRAFT_61619 [Hysterangium stoloniferum]|nr:hypothetical protein BU17DRAFT_61619 [Hysterangium stoloniferum]